MFCFDEDSKVNENLMELELTGLEFGSSVLLGLLRYSSHTLTSWLQSASIHFP